MKTHNHSHTSPQAAFTLIELAVVLSVIGLIIGGVLVGRSLIRSSELNAILTEEQQYVQAMQEFRMKYLTLPGDFGGSITSSSSGAAALWGTIASPSAANCRTTARSTSTETCNGNADGKIGEYNDTNSNYEQFTAWEHLRNAGFVSVNVNGLMTATYNKTPGTNVPRSKLSGAGWGITWLSQFVAATQAIVTSGDTAFKHVLWLGGIAPTTVATNQTNPILTGLEAMGFDQKIDDGYANTGNVVAQTNSSGTACVTTATSQYAAATGTSTICSLVFKTGF